MIDFVSTRETTDPQTAACARLLAAVIAQAMLDACTPLTQAEKRLGRNMNCDARQAVRFLFEPEMPFVLYARLIGGSADLFREALLRGAGSTTPIARPVLSEMDMRTLRQRFRMGWALQEERFIPTTSFPPASLPGPNYAARRGLTE